MRFRALNRLENLVRRVEAGQIDGEAAKAAIHRHSLRVSFNEELALQAADFVRRRLAEASQSNES